MKFKKNKIKKRIAIIALIILSLIIGAAGFVGNYFYNLALNPNTPKDIVFDATDDSDEEQVNWILEESRYTDQFMTSEDGLQLHAYEIDQPNDSHKWVITVHGYTSEANNMSGYAEGFYNMGYNVLVPDLRGHGMSEGNYIGMGWDDRLDIMQWIDYIIQKDKEAQIVLHGVSMGGATVMMVAGEQLPSNVKCIIEDSGYTSAWAEFAYQLKKLFNVPETPVLQLASLVGKMRAGYWISEASAIKQLEKATLPMLFIHGDADDFVPVYMLDEVYEAAQVEKEKLIIEGSKHAKSLETNSQLYWETISNFMSHYIS